jgi:hypothetical protein
LTFEAACHGLASRLRRSRPQSGKKFPQSQSASRENYGVDPFCRRLLDCVRFFAALGVWAALGVDVRGSMPWVSIATPSLQAAEREIIPAVPERFARKLRRRSILPQALGLRAILRRFGSWAALGVDVRGSMPWVSTATPSLQAAERERIPAVPERFARKLWCRSILLRALGLPAILRRFGGFGALRASTGHGVISETQPARACARAGNHEHPP